MLSQIYLDSLSGKTQGEAIEWLELAANFGHPIAKSIIYRVSKALDCYKNKESMILSHLVQGAEAGILMAIEDLVEADTRKGEAVLQRLRQRRHVQCKVY